MSCGGSEQQLRFRWNDHMQHVTKVLSIQRLEEQFCDVTLVSEDGFVMKAHQAVLASTSTYFQRVLCEVVCDQHPMIVLRGARFRELTCLLDYMYQGNTQVDQDLIDSVLEVADMLEVKGLSRMCTNSSIKQFIDQAAASTAVGDAAPADTAQSYRAGQVDGEGHSRLGRPSREAALVPMVAGHLQAVRFEADHHQDDQAAGQLSGIDLSMAKNEPWSPKDAPLTRRDRDEGEDDSTPTKQVRHSSEKPKQSPPTISLTSITTTDNDAGQHWHKSPVPKSKNSGTNSTVEKTLEVPCEDGPLTISLTTGQGLDTCRGLVKRRTLHCSAAPFKRVRRKFRARRSLDESRKKWLAKERRSLFGCVSAERPITRALERMKKKTAASVLDALEKVSVNCDPPFPTEEESSKNRKEKDALPPTQSKGEEVSRGQVSIKAGSSEAKDATSTWQYTDKRTQQEKYEEDATDDIKFRTISPLSLFTLPPVKEREKQTRTTLTLEEKVKVIEAFLDGKSQRQIAHLYGIGKTQVSGIIKRREEILTIYRDSLLRGEKLTMKRQRRSEYAALNQHLIKWYRHMTVAAGVKITTGMLRAKALQIAPELGYHDFKASNGWLATFKSNNNLKFSKQRKTDNYNDQDSFQQDSNTREEDESFFEEGESEGGSSHMAAIKQSGGASAVTPVTPDDTPGADMTTLTRTSQTGDTASNPSDQSSSLLHPGISSGPPKPPQMVNASLGANLTAAAAYNLSRDLSRDLSRADSTGVGDLSSSTMNTSPLNHPVTALNVSRAVIDNSLAKPSDGALGAYKSEEPLAYSYDPQNRMNDAGSRGAEYNYAPYGFPGSYYGYHFLGQY